MRGRSLALATLALLAACAHDPMRGLTPISGTTPITGDFDGDGRADSTGLFEDEGGHLLVVVQRAASRQPLQIWGGDISSLPAYEIHVAPPGHYVTACELYGPGCSGAPLEVTLTHEGVIVRQIEPRSDLLYYWDHGAFENIIVRE